MLPIARSGGLKSRPAATPMSRPLQPPPTFGLIWRPGLENLSLAPSNLSTPHTPRPVTPKTPFLEHLLPTTGGNRKPADANAIGRGSKPVRQPAASPEVPPEGFDGMFAPSRAKLPDQRDGGHGHGPVDLGRTPG